MDDAKGFVEGLSAHLAELRDPRVVQRCDHRLMDMISIAILAVFCGADEWTEIEAFGRHRADWLKSFLRLPNGTPSHDTFRRVFGRLDRQQFAAGLFGWMQALHAATGGKVVAIDGKSLRRSGRTSRGLRPLHLVTAWATENWLVLGQVPCEEKSNEITAIPDLLRLLNLKGYISSHAPAARQLGRALRQHWSIENSQHHVLDVTFDEDHRRQSDRNGAANLAAIRRLVLSILRQEKTHTHGAKCKRFTCALDPHYLHTVLASLKTTQL